MQHDDYYYLQALLIDPKEKFNPDLPRPLSKADILISNKRNGRKDFPYYLTSGKTIVSRSDQCNYRGNSENYSDCSGRVIKGSSYYFALQDNMRLGKHLDLGIGVRYDYRKTHSTVMVQIQGNTKNGRGMLVLSSNQQIGWIYLIAFQQVSVYLRSRKCTVGVMDTLAY